MKTDNTTTLTERTQVKWKIDEAEDLPLAIIEDTEDGEGVLEMGEKTPENIALAERICKAVNFYQQLPWIQPNSNVPLPNDGYFLKAVNNYDSLVKAHDELNENFHNQVGMYVDEVRKTKKLKAINDSLLNALKEYSEMERENHGIMPVFMRPVTNLIKEAIKSATT